MEKLLTEHSDYNLFGDVSAILEKNISPVLDFAINKRKVPKTLTECVKYFSKINDIENNLSGVSFGFTNYSLNDEMSSQKVRKIALMLAKAIDENSVEKIKELKKQYGHEREFATAKKFLDKKCKEIWDVFEFKKIKLKIPHAAMKSLGITNQPTLEFLLGDSIHLFEKDNGNSTANIISSILKNDNLTYKIEDIHKFLKKENEHYNFRTVAYLISEQNYDRRKLLELGIKKDTIEQALKTIPIKARLRYCLCNTVFKAIQIRNILFKSLNVVKFA